jgi:hypothetical protein
MPDLRTLLHDAAPSPETTPDIADADLLRARRGLRRRRASRLGAGTGLVAAVAVGALVLAGPGGAPSSPDGGATSAAPRGADQAVELVAYTGAQPSGYRLDMVPAGWEVREDSASLLTLAPETAPEREPGTMEGMIAVSTQSDTGAPSGVRLDDVTVGGSPAVIAHMEGPGDTRTLFARQPSGTYLVIQVWDGLGWDNDRIAQFAASVHVSDAAVPSVG